MGKYCSQFVVLFRGRPLSNCLFSAPDNGELPPINAFTLIANAVKVTGSAIGPPSQIKEMLEFAVEKKVVPWIEKRPLTEANQAIVDVEEGKARYRYVLVNEKNL